MTIEEMREKIIAHCNSVASCRACPLVELRDACYWNDETVEEHYKLIYGVKDSASEKARYWSNVCAMQKKQTEKGKRTYGQILEENTSMSMIERLEYLEEELIDALMYIEHIKALGEAK